MQNNANKTESFIYELKGNNADFVKDCHAFREAAL